MSTFSHELRKIILLSLLLMGNKQPKLSSRQSASVEPPVPIPDPVPQLGLPLELFEHIFLDIHNKNDIFNILITCKSWQIAGRDSKILWQEWLKALTGVEQRGDLVGIRSTVKAVFRKRFVARIASKSSTLSSTLLTIDCTVENLSDVKTLYLFCGHGLKLAREHCYQAGAAISIISGVGTDFGRKPTGIKDEWPSLWHTAVPNNQTVTLETMIQLIYVTVEYMDQQNNVRETKRHLVLHYGYHFWQVVDTKVVLNFTCQASFRPPPQTEGGCTISAIKSAYFANSSWVTSLELVHETNTITLDIDDTGVVESPIRLRALFNA